MTKSIPAAKSQNSDDTLGPQKPTWTIFLEFEIFLSEKTRLQLLPGKNQVGLTSSYINFTMKLLIKLPKKTGQK